MTKITFIQHDGEKETLDVESGTSVMSAAVGNMVSGIDGDCGGECNCATCHVYIDDAWIDKVGQPEPEGAEEAIMSLNPERKSSSRLGCQVKITDELDGIVVHMPEFQY